MKLKTEQIQELYAFTASHFVEWYDVQTELVDHLANGIELQWQENPEIKFKEALNREFKKFGVMGFSAIVEEKTKALNKAYWRMIWKYYKTYFKLPKIMLSLVLILVYHEILTFSMSYQIYWVLIPTLTLIFGAPWYVLIKDFKRIRRIKQETGKKWLIDQTLSQLGGLVHLMNIGIYFQVFFYVPAVWPLWMSLLFSTVIILFLILLYLAVAKISPELRKTMKKQHPEYQFS